MCCLTHIFKSNLSILKTEKRFKKESLEKFKKFPESPQYIRSIFFINELSKKMHCKYFYRETYPSQRYGIRRNVISEP